MRTIVHVDLDAFFSAIEQRDRPELRGKPVVVGGDPDARGVVATASYEARRFGIHSAMPCRTARRLCPEAIFVRPRFAAYRQVSDQLRAMFLALTPTVEPYSLDEAYLDITEIADSPSEAAPITRALKRDICETVKLTASVGVGVNKLIAKVASDREKPDGLTIVPAGEEGAFLAPLPVRHLFGIGPRSEERLNAAGIHLVRELADADPGRLRTVLGDRALEWQQLARGIDDRPVQPYRELKQISRERTFARDIAHRDELRQIVHQMVDELIADLNGMPPARTVTLKLRRADWKTVTRRDTPGTVLTGEVLRSTALDVFERGWDGRPLRLVGVAVSNFIAEPAGQLSLFDWEDR